jgi:hypothetical protein
VLGHSAEVLAHGFEKNFNIGAGFGGGLFVGLGENEREGCAGGAEPGDEIEIDGLWRKPGVDENEDALEVLALFEVVADEFVEVEFLVFGGFGEAVSGEIDEAPRAIHEEEVEEPGFAGGGGDFGEGALVGEHVDHRGFPDIGAADEGEFGLVPFRASTDAGGADDEFGGLDLHAGEDWSGRRLGQLWILVGNVSCWVGMWVFEPQCRQERQGIEEEGVM